MPLRMDIPIEASIAAVGSLAETGRAYQTG